MAHIFDGRAFSKEKEEELKRRVLSLKKSTTLNNRKITPTLVAILVGEDPASKLYVGLKQKAAERVGVNFKLIQLNEATKDELLQLIKEYNQSNEVHGIMIQLPIPGIDSREETREILATISPEKDVDGESGKGNYLAATVRAILYALRDAQGKQLLSQDPKEFNTCVVGATGMVGSALVKELEKLGANVVGTNTKTQDLKAETIKADLIVSVTGREGIIKKDMVKPGAVIIDVGAPKADVEEGVREVASFVTPVPGGIGPMTVVCLLENTVESAEKKSV